MDYEKKYKEALERAKRCYKDLNNLDGVVATMSKDFFEEVFPELKDSEDERIRKALIKVFSNREKYLIDQSFGDITVSEALVWLEKQGKKDVQVILPTFTFDDILALECSMKEVEKDEKLYNQLQSLYNRVHDVYLLEKQGEQKSIDKVEPKFKVGDWVVHNRNDHSREIMQIYDIRDGRYYFNDNVHFSWSIKECDEKSRLWTIQDAEDGDVLVTKKGNPFLYDKNRYNNELAYYYVGLDVNNELVSKSHHRMLAHFGKLSSIFPATKEQHDLLFQKMYEAGYEWDAEKKELTGIKQEYNEQKAKEIAKHILETYPVINKDNLPNALWFAAIEMAEWKEEEYAKKSWDWFLKNADKFACINTDDNMVTFDYAKAKENFLKYVKE